MRLLSTLSIATRNPLFQFGYMHFFFVIAPGSLVFEFYRMCEELAYVFHEHVFSTKFK